MYKYYVDQIKDAGGYFDPDSGVVLQWTTVPPTKDGWYWVDTTQWANLGVPEIVQVRLMDDKRLMAFEAGDDVGVPVSVYEFWLGPLPVPEPPK